MTDTRTTPDTPNGVRSSARGRARDAADRANEGIESNPLAVLVGGAALGMLAGALLPSSERERETLRPLGKRVADGAKAAALAARDAGKAEFESIAPDRETAKNKASGFLTNVAKAAADAGKSAATGKKSA